MLASDPITLAADSLARYAVLVERQRRGHQRGDPAVAAQHPALPAGVERLGGARHDARHPGRVCGVRHRTLRRAYRDHRRGLAAPGRGDGGWDRAQGAVDRQAPHAGGRPDPPDEGSGGRGHRPHRPGVRPATGRRRHDARPRSTKAAGFLEQIGILDEARIARSFAGVSAMHDVTEGGLATAVRELGAAGGRRLRLHLDRIPVYPQTGASAKLSGWTPWASSARAACSSPARPTEAGGLVAAIRPRGHRGRPTSVRYWTGRGRRGLRQTARGGMALLRARRGLAPQQIVRHCQIVRSMPYNMAMPNQEETTQAPAANGPAPNNGRGGCVPGATPADRLRAAYWRALHDLESSGCSSGSGRT